MLGTLVGCSSQAEQTVESAKTAETQTTTSETKSSASEKAALVIAGPATPSSIPLIIAAEKMGNADVQIIENNSQANTAFLRGDISILVSGLSVGVDLYRNQAPVQIVNSYVTGMSSLVTYGEKVENFSELKGQEIYIPFEGSPIEEATSYLAKQEGLSWGKDLKPIYSPFDASVALLKQGKAKAVVLPEPFVSVIEGQKNLNISIDYFARWNKATGSTAGYPQVAAFVTRDWAQKHPAELAAFNSALEDAVKFIQENPEQAVSQVKDHFKLPEKVLLKSISRTHFSVATGDEMKNSVTDYYRLIGKPLDDGYKDFYYLPEK